jgi:hypothetical protein
MGKWTKQIHTHKQDQLHDTAAEIFLDTLFQQTENKDHEEFRLFQNQFFKEQRRTVKTDWPNTYILINTKTHNYESHACITLSINYWSKDK